MILSPMTSRPRRCTPSELSKVGVVLIDESYIRVAGEGCGREWSTLLCREGRLPQGYWRCPEGCQGTA